MKALYFLLFFITDTTAFAQLSWQNSFNFNPPNELNYQGNIIYTWNYIPNTYYEYELTIYNNEFAQLNKLTFKNSKYSYLKSAMAIENNVYFYLLMGKTAYIVKVDEKGNKQKEISFDDSESDIYKMFLKTDGKNLYIGRSVKEKKRGFVVACFDVNLNIKWNYLQIPDKGSNNLEFMEASPKGIIALTSFAKNAFSNSSYSTMAINMEGKATDARALKMGNQLNFLLSKSLSDGSMLDITSYGERNKGIEKMPLGLQIDKIGSDGKLLKSYKIDYALVSEKTQVQTRNSPFGIEPVALHPVDVIELSTGTQVICESYYFEIIPINTGTSTTTVASKEGFYHLLDFVSINIDNDNFSISTTPKPHRIIKLENIMVIGDGSAYEELYNDRAFSYQFSNNGKIYTKGWHKGFYYYSINNTLGEYEDLNSRVYFGKPILNSFDVRGINALVVREPDFGNNNLLQLCGLMHFANHYIVYDYRFGKLYYSIINY